MSASSPRAHGAADAAEALWYSDSAGAVAARSALAPLSLLFGLGVKLRGALYDNGAASVESAPAPVLSVGALRVGGAGKTPFVLWLARELRTRGRRPCIVTRGYGREVGGTEPWLLEETGAMAPGAAARAGDEAVLLALRSGGPVAMGADRAAACRHAHAELAGTGEEPDIYILDDGFQHRRLSRALDIVLVSGSEDRERLLPAGPLRETAAALSRANAVVTVRSASAPVPTLSAPASALRLDAVVRVAGMVTAVSDVSIEPAASLDGRRVVAVCGIARPERFLRDLEAAGAHVAASVLRRDHHRYGDSDLREIDAAARDADLVVTTEKDLVKLGGASFRAPLRALRIDLEIASAPAGELLAERAASLATA